MSRQEEPEAHKLQLLDLPDLILQKIIEAVKHWRSTWDGQPLLAVCRDTRDTIIGNAQSLRLTVKRRGHSDSNDRALCRMLHRVCCKARLSRHVTLDVVNHPKDILGSLLQPGVERQGWRNVQRLQVSRVPVQVCCGKQLLGP
jgi:hypothetical protein